MNRADEIAKEVSAMYDVKNGGILLRADALSIHAFARRCVEAGAEMRTREIIQHLRERCENQWVRKEVEERFLTPATEKGEADAH